MPESTSSFPAMMTTADLLSEKDPLTLLQPEDRFAVLGYPIAHSLSPGLQNAALKNALLPYRYISLEVKPEELGATLKLLSQRGFLGLNITIPHKQAVLTHLDEISDHARFLGAVNTISIRNQQLIGCNTDGPGLVGALQEKWNLRVCAQRILILGANGGAGRAIAAECVLEGCMDLYLASRTPETLEQEIKRLSEYSYGSIPIHALELSEEALSQVMPHVDLIINATPVGMYEGEPSLIPSHLFNEDQYVYDIIYSSTTTPLMKSAQEAGAQAANGLLMLVHQAALAFQIWFDMDPPIDVMRKYLQ